MLSKRKNKRGMTISLLILILCFSLLVLSLSSPWLVYLDTIFGEGLRELHTAFWFTLFITISTLGDTQTYMVIFLLTGAYFYLRYKEKRDLLLLLSSLVGAWLLNTLIKRMIQRPRPDLEQIVEASGYSFPSGHAMISMAFYGMIAYLLWKYGKNNVLNKLLALCFGMLIVLIGLARVYLGVHYPSDILAGFILGGAWLLACLLCFGTNRAANATKYISWERYM